MRPPSRWDRLLSLLIYWTVELGRAVSRFRYRKLGGRCYACPGGYGAHKFSCPVGIKEASLDRD